MPPEPIEERVHAFSVAELVIAIAITSLLALLLLPALTGPQRARDLTNAAQKIADAFDLARTYAIANNTYVWLGIYEESDRASGPTNSTPPYPGQGRVILATVASRDGTTACQDPASTTTTRIALVPTQIIQVGQLIRIANIHITDIGPPSASSTSTPDPSSIEGRPNYPYVFGSPTVDYQNRISSDDLHTPFNQTLYPFVAQGYTFHKTVRFNPRGEAHINSTYSLRRVAEIGIRDAHGTTVGSGDSDIVAIQFSGMTGRCRIYRK